MLTKQVIPSTSDSPFHVKQASVLPHGKTISGRKSKYRSPIELTKHRHDKNNRSSRSINNYNFSFKSWPTSRKLQSILHVLALVFLSLFIRYVNRTTAEHLPRFTAHLLRHNLPFYLISSNIPSLSLSSHFSSLSSSSISYLFSSPPSGTSLTAFSNCPPVCSCMWKSGKETATCDKRNLISVPVGLSSTTLVIDLSGNSLNVLPPNVFLDRGMTNLQRIFLIDCQLVDISTESFVKLSNLIELDLGNNSLTTIPTKSLAECFALRRLSLFANRIREVRSAAFLLLVHLNVLDLSYNLISHLDTDAFRGLRSLQTLKLEGNKLQTLPAAESFIQFFPLKMASLGLHDNRWRCDCHLKPIREWIVLNNIPLPVKPVCSAPFRLQGQKWDSISTHEFSCPPQIHISSTHFYKHLGNNVTISCPVTGYPPPVIFWLFETFTSNVAEIYDSTLGQFTQWEIANQMNKNDSNSTIVKQATGKQAAATELATSLPDINRTSDTLQTATATTTIMTTHTSLPATAKEYHSMPKSVTEQMLPSVRYSVTQEIESNHQLISTLTVYGLQQIDTQRITCFARNIGGSAMKNFSLVVSTQEPFSSSRSMDFIVTEMFVIFVSISFLLLVLLILVALFISKFKKSHSHVHAVSHDDAHNVIHHQGFAANEFSLSADRTDDGLLLKGHNNMINFLNLNKKNDLLDSTVNNKTISTIPYSSALLPTSGIPNSATHATFKHCTDSLLIVNVANKMQNVNHYKKSTELEAVPSYASDANSSDLSSQSNKATSISANCCVGAEPNSEILNSHDPIASIATSQIPHSLSFCQSHPPSNTCLNITPDLLASTHSLNGFYVDASGNFLTTSRVNVCDYLQKQHQELERSQPVFHSQQNAYPLLDTAQLIESSGELIYGTRIAHTKPPTKSVSTPLRPSAKLNKVNCSDPLSNNDKNPQPLHKFAYTYGPLRNPISCADSASDFDLHQTIESQRHLVAFSNNHDIESTPSIFLPESSVDSGEPIGNNSILPQSQKPSNNVSSQQNCKPINYTFTANNSINEADEDDYYRLLNVNKIENDSAS